MMKKFDFHIHTNASDGSCTPEELVEKAAREGVTLLAVTDHDTVSGVAEAVRAGKRLGVRVIPGLEISIDFGPGTFHLCGYGIDIRNGELLTALDFVQQARRNRNSIIVEKLNSIGVAITLDEVKAVAGPDQVGRPHFARVILDKGYAASVQEVFDTYLAKGKPGYVDKKRLSVEEALRVIAAAGGVSVLAHPVQLKLERNAYATFIAGLKAAGMTGIEVCSSCHTAADSAFFTAIADELQLVKTAGSDFHGETKPDIGLGDFGNGCLVNPDDLLRVLERA
ncbi:PHP domain-containing protein [bacterium]|nr:PHP domain-containing protein [bacterium]